MTGKEAKKIRESLSLKRPAWAAALGVSVRTVEAWEDGAREIKLYTKNLMLLTAEKLKNQSEVI